MAGIADRRLLGFHQHRVLGHMDGMATDTGQSFALMHAALPANPMAVLMTAQAGRIVFGDRGRRMFAKAVYGDAGFAGMQVRSMLAARTMAGFALQMCERRVWVGAGRMLGFEYGQCLGVVMAAQAGIGATQRIGDRCRLRDRLRCIRSLTRDIEYKQGSDTHG